MPQEYYYASSGQQVGPVSISELRELLRNNQLATTDLVWTEGMSDWKPAADVPGLAFKSAVAAPSGASSGSPASQKSVPVQSPPSTSSPSQSAAGAGAKLLGVAREQTLRFLANVRSTAVATAGHVNQFVACVMARGQTKLALREAVRQRAALGQRMCGAGLGDADNRRIIDDIERRIRNAQSAGHSKRSLEQELQAAHAAIAESALESDQPPAGLEREFEAARTARDGLLTAQQAATDRRSGLRAMHSSQGLRIGIGYACAFLIISSLVWAARGTGRPTAKQNVPHQPGNVVDNNPGGDPGGGGGGGGDDGGLVNNPNPEPAPEFIQNPVSSNEKTTCTNCFGTGQADCLACFGRGKKTCGQCNGTGRPPSAPNIQCFGCNGTGQQKCFSCNYGKIQCLQCFGTGKR